jgi:hypothetical protein
VLDEIQKIPSWSETVKRLWDEDTQRRDCAGPVTAAQLRPRVEGAAWAGWDARVSPYYTVKSKEYRPAAP